MTWTEGECGLQVLIFAKVPWVPYPETRIMVDEMGDGINARSKYSRDGAWGGG